MSSRKSKARMGRAVPCQFHPPVPCLRFRVRSIGSSMRRHSFAFFAAVLLGAAPLHAQAGRGGGNPETAIKPGEECPAGMTLIRPGRCQAPQAAPPSILDYRPHSTLVTTEHKVPRAKYPAVD